MFDGAIFDPDIFDTGAPALTGMIPRNSTARLAVPGRPSASIVVPDLSSTSIEVPARPSAEVET